MISAAQNDHLDIEKYLESLGSEQQPENNESVAPFSSNLKGKNSSDYEGDVNVNANNEATLEQFRQQWRNAIEHGNASLIWAVKEGRLDIVKYLVEQEANVNQADKDGDTPLNWAAKKGHLDIVEYLVEHRADVNQANKYGDTPLISAVRNGHLNVVKYLIEHGADFYKRNNDGNTPLYLADKRGHSNIVEYLRNLERLQDPNDYERALALEEDVNDEKLALRPQIQEYSKSEQQPENNESVAPDKSDSENAVKKDLESGNPQKVETASTSSGLNRENSSNYEWDADSNISEDWPSDYFTED